jgi:hypothetical protein
MVLLTSELVHPNGATTVVPVNSPRPVEFKNANFQGRVIFLHRDFSDTHFSYFASKKRFWELRWQGRFLRPPSGPVYIGAELRQPLPEHGFLLRTTALCALAFARTVASARGARMECNYEDEISDRRFVLFPLLSADVKIASDSASSAPDIAAAQDLIPDVNFDVEISDQKIYTFGFYTMYTDLGNWCFANFPIISGKSLAAFAGYQPIYAVMREDEKYYLEMKFTHDIRSPAFESAISDPDDQIALLDLPATLAESAGTVRVRRGLRRKFVRCFGACWSELQRLLSR